MSALKYVNISTYFPEVGDILVVQNKEDIGDSLFAKILEVRESSDEATSYMVQVMRSTKSFIAGNKFLYTLDRTAGPIIGAVIPKENKDDGDVDLEVTVEELTLFNIMTLVRPFAQQGRAVRLRTAIDYLRAHNVVGDEMSDARVRSLIKRAIALRPDKLKLTSGWIKMEHTPSATPAAPQNFATTERVVDKQRLLKTVNDFVIGLCESGVLGPISWKIE